MADKLIFKNNETPQQKTLIRYNTEVNCFFI